VPEFRNFAYLEGMFNTWNSKTKQMSKIQLVQQITVSNILLWPTHYCVQQFIVTSKILCPRSLTFNIPLFNFPLSPFCDHIMLRFSQPFISLWETRTLTTIKKRKGQIKNVERNDWKRKESCIVGLHKFTSFICIYMYGWH